MINKYLNRSILFSATQQQVCTVNYFDGGEEEDHSKEVVLEQAHFMQDQLEETRHLKEDTSARKQRKVKGELSSLFEC